MVLTILEYNDKNTQGECSRLMTERVYILTYEYAENLEDVIDTELTYSNIRFVDSSLENTDQCGLTNVQLNRSYTDTLHVDCDYSTKPSFKLVSISNNNKKVEVERMFAGEEFTMTEVEDE